MEQGRHEAMPHFSLPLDETFGLLPLLLAGVMGGCLANWISLFMSTHPISSIMMSSLLPLLLDMTAYFCLLRNPSLMAALAVSGRSLTDKDAPSLTADIGGLGMPAAMGGLLGMAALGVGSCSDRQRLWLTGGMGG